VDDPELVAEGLLSPLLGGENLGPVAFQHARDAEDGHTVVVNIDDLLVSLSSLNMAHRGCRAGNWSRWSKQQF
jgi:hypothetical protein